MVGRGGRCFVVAFALISACGDDTSSDESGTQTQTVSDTCYGGGEFAPDECCGDPCCGAPCCNEFGGEFGCESGMQCMVDADCGAGSCVLNIEYVNECSDYDYGCAPDEAFVFGDDTGGVPNHCVIYTTCWSDDGCPAPYTCVDVSWLNWEAGDAMGGTSQLCARALPLEPEDP